MPNLVETYSLSTGLRISNMELYEEFIPLVDCEKYIVVVSGSGMGGKNYSYLNEVLGLISSPLLTSGYKIVQLGEANDEKLDVNINLCGQTTINQFFYVIKNCELVLSADTSAIHLAGHYNKKLVALFGLTDPRISGAYFGNKENQSYITPKAHKPTFNPNESPKTVNGIKPETVATEIGKLLKFDINVINTLYIGKHFKMRAVELIPDHIITSSSFPHNQVINIRFDYGGIEDLLYKNIAQRKSTIVTDKALDVNVLTSLKENIESIVYNIDMTNDVKFVDAIHKTGIPYILISYKSETELQSLKLDYIDYNMINRKNISCIEEFSGVTKDTYVETNKVLINKDGGYASYAHFKASISHRKESSKIIDSPDFWKDVDFFYLWNN